MLAVLGNKGGFLHDTQSKVGSARNRIWVLESRARFFEDEGQLFERIFLIIWILNNIEYRMNCYDLIWFVFFTTENNLLLSALCMTIVCVINLQKII